jgi:hypothetical protein
VRDRCGKSHEQVFLLTKSLHYYFDYIAIQEPSADGGMRNKRSVWTIPTKGYKGAHFACFPPKLVEPMILAGTSQAGCCEACGAPHKRLVKRTRVPTRPGRDTKVVEGGERVESKVCGNRDPLRHVTKVETLGWEPSCKCGAGTVPCVVLDPFVGSGTTLQVALELGRNGIGLELNPDYVSLAEERVGKHKITVVREPAAPLVVAKQQCA